MKITQPSVEILTPIYAGYILKFIEQCGRVCYKSENKMLRNESTPKGKEIWQAVDNAAAKCPQYLKEKIEDGLDMQRAKKFVKNLINRGHESVLEHFNITVKVITNRGISHEIVRHRIGAYSQESTRYVSYKDGINVIEQNDLKKYANKYARESWAEHMRNAEKCYQLLIDLGIKPEIARDVLPNALKTEIVITYNLRQWRHFIKQRSSKAAHPQIQQIALMILKEFKEKIPVIFDDINGQG